MSNTQTEIQADRAVIPYEIRRARTYRLRDAVSLKLIKLADMQGTSMTDALERAILVAYGVEMTASADDAATIE